MEHFNDYWVYYYVGHFVLVYLILRSVRHYGRSDQYRPDAMDIIITVVIGLTPVIGLIITITILLLQRGYKGIKFNLPKWM